MQTISKRSASSLSSSSSDDVDKFFVESIMLHDKSDKLGVCIGELRALADKLTTKSNALRQLEKRLVEKEQRLVDFASTVDAFVEGEVASKCDRMMNEKREMHLALEQKLRALTADHDRLQNSFQALRAHNEALRTRLETTQRCESSLQTELARLRGKLSCRTPRSNGADDKCRLRSDGATQTGDDDDALGMASAADQRQRAPVTAPAPMSPASSTVSLVAALRLSWALLIHKSLAITFSSPASASIVTGKCLDATSLSDLCLLVIPMAADHLRNGLLLPSAVNRASRVPRHGQRQMTALHNATASAAPGHQKLETISHLLEMLHFSLLYLDISRSAIRISMMSSLTRFSEELVWLLRSKSDNKTYKKEVLRSGLETEILISLVALRTVNSANDLAFVITYILDMIDNFDEAFELFLSKLFLVPLLCRWSSTFNCYGSISSKVISLVHRSLDKTGHVSLNNCPIIVNGTGFDQLVLLATRTQIIPAESDPKNNYHVLVVLLDLLCGSKPPNQELMVDIIERIVPVKAVRRMLKDLGIVGIITGFITKYPTVSQTNIQCLAKLRMILTQLNVDVPCK